MSKTNSPWSMVGMLMSTPRLRSATRKRKDKGKSETVNVQPPPQQDEGVASQRREEPVVAVVPIEEPFVVTTAMSVEGDIAASFADEQLYRVVARPATPEENENGWTTVAAQQKPSSASSTGSTASQSRASPNADEDIVDVLSQSVSVEFLNQQTQAPSDGPSYLASELERKEANITSLIIEKQELESRLGAMFDELANLNRRNQELDDENRRQAQAIQLAEGTVQVLKDEMAEAKKGEEMIRREVEDGLQRIRSLEEEQYGKSEALKETESTLQRERRNREGAQLELEESAKRNKDLEERTRRLLEEHQVGNEELKRLQNLNAKANDALRAALADLARAEEERDAVHGRLRGSETRCKGLEEQNERLIEDCHAGEKRLEGLRGLHVTTTTATEAALVDLASAVDEKAALLVQVAQQAGELTKQDKELQDLKRSQAEVVKLPNQRQLDVVECRNRMLMDQLRRQSEQLRQKTFPRQDPLLPTPEPSLNSDHVSGGVAGMLDRLNSEIFQAAAHMADSLDFTSPMSLNAQELKGVVERASVTMGKPLALVLQATSAQPGVEFNPLPVQIGLQACLISCCAKIMTSWCPGHWEYGDFLAAIYRRIVGSTPQSIALKWRALTERQLKTPSDSTTQVEMEDYMLRNLVDALVIAGWRRTQLNARDLLAKFRERLGQLVKVALRLNLALGDDWEVMVVHPNELFDANIMDDAYDGEEENQRGDHVVCTTELGLRTGGNLVLKPKVVLRAMLTEETGYDAF